jgi:hypothetical protein
MTHKEINYLFAFQEINSKNNNNDSHQKFLKGR